MSKVRVESFAISIDGFGAGPNQSLENPLGEGGMALHEWALATKTFKAMFGEEGGTTGLDDQFARQGFDNIGAWILGRNMFAPTRGSWGDTEWEGWWGDEPPYHVPVFILTHHPRNSIVMKGGTTFHFVSGGIHAVLEQARAAANGMDVRIGGGANTIRQYLEARLVDHIHLAISPTLLGAGKHLFEGLNLVTLGEQISA
ncbi:MAG: dihydrofolate reductase family protein [Gammaproteobacteria bacterium]|nr:dihydrofolate reductase family protein [Gammaproteobacteria bacterium]